MHNAWDKFFLKWLKKGEKIFTIRKDYVFADTSFNSTMKIFTVKFLMNVFHRYKKNQIMLN